MCAHRIVTRGPAVATYVGLSHGSQKIAMNALKLLWALALSLAPVLALAPAPVLAAHAGDPYRNVDHSNDKGNDTGDSQVDGLNGSQLNGNYQGPVELRAPANNPVIVEAPTAPTPPGFAPR
jgi:hypothetical protein